MRGMKAAMERGKVQLYVCPLRWVGVRGWMGAEALAQFKGCCFIRAWDPDSKTWWVPETFEPLVRAALGLPQNMPPDIRLEPRPRETHEIIEPRRADMLPPGVQLRLVGWREPHWLDSDPYKVLMVERDAPQGLVDTAMAFWRWSFTHQNGGVGGVNEPLERAEAAYAEICRVRLAADEADKQGIRREVL